jgi:hypothetical protein
MDTRNRKDDMASNAMVGAVLLGLADPSLSSLIVRLVPSTSDLAPLGALDRRLPSDKAIGDKLAISQK